MPRRQATKGVKPPLPNAKRRRDELEDEDSYPDTDNSLSSDASQEDTSQDGLSEEEALEDDEGDADAPRIVQWDDDDDLEYEEALKESTKKPTSDLVSETKCLCYPFLISPHRQT